jgi:hypothetical protein
MKLSLKYGLSITVVVALWVLITRLLVPLNPESKANLLAPLVFNLAAMIAIYLGIRESNLRRTLSFKQGLHVGMKISLVYALSSCLLFFVLFLILGPKLMEGEAVSQSRPLWQIAVVAYTGLFLGALFLGLIYSTVSSFLIVKASRT